MAEKISVEIGLEGGAEVERQLENIGKTGAQAFSEIQTAADQVNLESTTEEFKNLGNAGVTAFNKVQEAAQSAAVFEQVAQGIKKVEGAFQALGTAATKMATRMTRSLGVLGVAARALGPIGIAAGVAGGAFVKFGDDVADSINGITAAAAKLDQTPQQLDKLQKALSQTGVSADAISSGLQKFKESLGEDFFPVDLTTGLQRFIAQLERMPDGVARTQLAMQRLGDALGAQVIAGLQTGTITAESFATALGAITPVTQEQIAQAARYQQALNQMSAAWTQFKAEIVAPVLTPVFQFLTQELQTFRGNVQSFISDIRAIWDALQTIDQFTFSALASAWSAITSAAQQAGAAVNEFLNTLTGGAWGSFADAAIASWNQVIGVIQQAIQLVRQFFSMQPQQAGGGGGGFKPWTGGDASKAGFAGGGMIGGRGTGTSDSNLAWVSRGEHIMPARAVARPGVLSFLEALRHSGGNLRGVLDGMGRFARGGLVPRSVPAFAGGGLVGSMSNVTIHFPGVPPITGLRASSEVINELQKSAALAQVRSGGRKPSRYS